MKILFHFRTRGTGAEGVHIAGVAKAFGELGHRVIFSSPTGVDPRATAGASPYVETGRRTLFAQLSRRVPPLVFELFELAYNLPALFRNAAILRREKCGLIYERHAFFLCSTALLSKWFRVPLVVEVNELVGDERVRKQPLLAPLARWCDRVIFHAASLIVVVSPHLKRRIEASGIDGGKVLVLPNAVNREDFETPADGREVRRLYGLENAMVIGFVGWFVPWHRLDMLVEAFAEIAARHAAAKLLLVGEGELRSAIERRARELGVADRVVFSGAARHADVPAHIAAMDVCVVPHSNEYRSPIKLFEYMAQGRAVVAPRTEPVEMVVRDGANGLLFEPNASEKLAALLEKLSDDAALRERLGRQACRDVFENHTWTQNCRHVLDKLAELGFTAR